MRPDWQVFPTQSLNSNVNSVDHLGLLFLAALSVLGEAEASKEQLQLLWQKNKEVFIQQATVLKICKRQMHEEKYTLTLYKNKWMKYLKKTWIRVVVSLIGGGMATEIIHISTSECKSDFINENGRNIFIDNSFQERLMMKKKHSIPVFDVDAISTLINWKE